MSDGIAKRSYRPRITKRRPTKAKEIVGTGKSCPECNRRVLILRNGHCIACETRAQIAAGKVRPMRTRSPGDVISLALTPEDAKGKAAEDAARFVLTEEAMIEPDEVPQIPALDESIFLHSPMVRSGKTSGWHKQQRKRQAAE